MNKNLFRLFLTTTTLLVVCFAVSVPNQKIKILDVDPFTARSLLNNDFESGFSEPWYDSSPSTIHWTIEDFAVQSETSNPAPAPSAGTKYLRANRNQQLSSGFLILRTVTFTAFPGDEISFNFWIRSRYTGGNTLELVLAEGDLETTLLSLSSYSTSVNLEWRPAVSLIPVTEPKDVTLTFYAYCGGNVEDAIAIDDIIVDSTITTTTQLTTTPLPTSTTPLPTTSLATSTTPLPTPNTTLSTPNTTLPTPTTLLPGDCGGYYSEPSGVIASPNFPNPYGYNEICEYGIQVTEGNRVALNFLYFDTESGADYVTVHDGLTISSPVLIRASGSNSDLFVATSGSGCLIVHSSDANNSRNGWTATYATA